MTNLFFSIGQKIRNYLEINSLSQTELAEKVGISKQVMNKIILGKKSINVQEITRLAKAMNVSFDYLMTYEEPYSGNPFLVMMGSIGTSNTKDDLSFLDHVMDEMIELEELLQS